MCCFNYCRHARRRRPVQRRGRPRHGPTSPPASTWPRSRRAYPMAIIPPSPTSPPTRWARPTRCWPDGKPAGVKTYTPYHATGDEFLHDYLGMIGLPMDILPQFPADAGMVLLTEQARFDPEILGKIQGQLEGGQGGLHHLRFPPGHERQRDRRDLRSRDDGGHRAGPPLRLRRRSRAPSAGGLPAATKPRATSSFPRSSTSTSSRTTPGAT